MSFNVFTILTIGICATAIIVVSIAMIVGICGDKDDIGSMKAILIIASICLTVACSTLFVGGKSYNNAMKPAPKCPYCDTVLEGELPKVPLEIGEHVWNYYTCTDCNYSFKVEMWAPIVEIGRIVECTNEE